MTTTNGRYRATFEGEGDRLRVVLYVRVSTDEQSKSGYSVPDQKRRLLHHAEREGWRVVEVVVDDGWGGKTLDRPGLRRIMELAEGGEIDAAVAIKRNRLFRSRFYRLLWDRDLKELGVALMALDDTGFRMADGMLDDYAEWEHEQIAERTMNGKLQAARQGRIVASSAAPRYGYKYTDDRRGFLVDSETMPTVHEIFRAVAGGRTLYGVVDDLNRSGVPSPRAGANGTSGLWTTAVIRQMIKSPAYEPHSHAEVAALVAPEVATRLDENESYELWYYADVPVPIPDSGIPRELVRAAREGIKHNRAASNMGYRTWTLTAGTLKCALCGFPMVSAMTTQSGKRYFYYRCSKSYRGHPRCENKRLLRAEETEELVWAFVSDLFRNPEVLLHEWDKRIEAERASLRDPGKKARTLARHITELDQQKARAQDLAIRGLLDPDDLAAKLREIDSQRLEAQSELENAAKGADRLKELEDQRALFPEFARAVSRRLGTLTPEEHAETYRFLNLGFEANDGVVVGLSGDFERIGLICTNETPSSTVSAPNGDP